MWNYLSGKKRIIALIYWSVVVPSLMVIWPDGFHTHAAMITYKVCTIFGFLLSAIGLGHAAVKTYSSKKLDAQIDEQIAKEETNVEEEQQKAINGTTEIKKDS